MLCFMINSQNVLRISVQRMLFRMRTTTFRPALFHLSFPSMMTSLPCTTKFCAVIQSSLHTSAFRTMASEDIHLSQADFENIAAETLESLAERLENLPEEVSCTDDFDVTLGDGVLTLNLGGSLGTYVINKQTPNKQIWLSSPTSGPKRYDFRNKRWIYSHDNKGLHSLLEKELSTAMQASIDLSACAFYS